MYANSLGILSTACPCISINRSVLAVADIHDKSPIFIRSLPYLSGVSHIYQESPIFIRSLPYLSGVSHIYQESPIFIRSLPYVCSQILELNLLLSVSKCFPMAYWLSRAELSSNMVRALLYSGRGTDLWLRS